MGLRHRDLDRKRLSKADYMDKYYSDINLDGWELWMNNTILKCWNIDKRSEFLNDWGTRMNSFDFNEMERFYLDEKELNLFDEDVKLFIAFLAGDGFFMQNEVSFSKWIKSKNFTCPNKKDEQYLSIVEALCFDGGMNYVRKQLVNLYWWR